MDVVEESTKGGGLGAEGLFLVTTRLEPTIAPARRGGVCYQTTRNAGEEWERGESDDNEI